MSPQTTLELHRQQIARAINYLERQLDAEFNVAELSIVAACSEFHFHRVFRALVGESVMAHIRRLRLERAARALCATDHRVIDIALSAGFDAHEPFTRAFTRQFGVPPSEWRRSRRAIQQRSLAAAPPADFAHLERREPVTVLSVRHVGFYGGVGDAWRRLDALRRDLAIVPRGALGLCHDDPEVTEPARFRYDACLVLGGASMPSSAPDGAMVQRVGSGTFAVTTHRGSYTRLSETYGRLTRWALERGQAPGADPSVERYLDLPSECPEEEQRTEVALAIE